MVWTPRNIRRLRERLEMNEAQFARVSGLSGPDVVTKMEKGVYKPTDYICGLLDTLKARADAKEA